MYIRFYGLGDERSKVYGPFVSFDFGVAAADKGAEIWGNTAEDEVLIATLKHYPNPEYNWDKWVLTDKPKDDDTWTSFRISNEKSEL